MKKNETLFKKVDFFERLAVYGNRSSFLKALAQENNIDPNTKAIIQEMKSLIMSSGVSGADPILDPLNRALISNELDIDQVNNAVMNALTQMGGVSSAGASSKLFQLIGKLRPNLNSPASTMQQTVLDNKLYPTIDKNKQRALSKIVTVKGLGSPLEIDGLLGPETKKAINLVKNDLKLNVNPYFSDDEVLTWAKMIAELPEFKTPEFNQI